MCPSSTDAAQLRAELAALEQLLEIQEQTVSEQAQRLETQAAELQRSNHALEQFAYVISHDLQEPLRMVAAYTELLRDSYQGKLDESADKYISFASGGARRMQELINALLDYSRVTTRTHPFERLDLDRIVDDALLNLTVAIEESGAVITRQPLGTVMGDRAQLIRVVQNLVANAIKFRRESTAPRVDISADGVAREGDPPGELLRLAIRDDGIGIEPRHHARIFDMFRRIHPKRYPGTGVGLSVCQRLVERHGGTIRVESALGHGSTFLVTLPRAERGA
jgi:light-regulated signal transduction histidine kinase (bacteriophytochrome)